MRRFLLYVPISVFWLLAGFAIWVAPIPWSDLELGPYIGWFACSFVSLGCLVLAADTLYYWGRKRGRGKNWMEPADSDKFIVDLKRGHSYHKAGCLVVGDAWWIQYKELPYSEIKKLKNAQGKPFEPDDCVRGRREE